MQAQERNGAPVANARQARGPRARGLLRIQEHPALAECAQRPDFLQNLAPGARAAPSLQRAQQVQPMHWLRGLHRLPTRARVEARTKRRRQSQERRHRAPTRPPLWGRAPTRQMPQQGPQQAARASRVWAAPPGWRRPEVPPGESEPGPLVAPGGPVQRPQKPLWTQFQAASEFFFSADSPAPPTPPAGLKASRRSSTMVSAAYSSGARPSSPRPCRHRL